MKVKTYILIPQEKEITLNDITKTQLRYVDIIEMYKRDYKKVPTIRTIGELVGNKSTASTFYMLKELKKKGYDYNAI